MALAWRVAILGAGMIGAVHRRAAELATRTGVVATVPFVYRFRPMGREMGAAAICDAVLRSGAERQWISVP